jgi:glycosyltransferase involved in cell wall biosynthesis
MNETPFFTVIMPTYGRGRHITPTLESVLAQSFGDFELIVVGDGCTDETEQAVRMFADDRVRWLNLPENTGSQSSPNNEGIRAPRGHWIAYIGHDDIWAPDHLDRMVNTITSTEGLDFVASGCIFTDPGEVTTITSRGCSTRPTLPTNTSFLRHRLHIGAM